MMHERVQCTVRNDGIFIPYIRGGGGGGSGQRRNNAGYATAVHSTDRYEKFSSVLSVMVVLGKVATPAHSSVRATSHNRPQLRTRLRGHTIIPLKLDHVLCPGTTAIVLCTTGEVTTKGEGPPPQGCKMNCYNTHDMQDICELTEIRAC